MRAARGAHANTPAMKKKSFVMVLIFNGLILKMHINHSDVLSQL